MIRFIHPVRSSSSNVGQIRSRKKCKSVSRNEMNNFYHPLLELESSFDRYFSNAGKFKFVKMIISSVFIDDWQSRRNFFKLNCKFWTLCNYNRRTWNIFASVRIKIKSSRWRKLIVEKKVKFSEQLTQIFLLGILCERVKASLKKPTDIRTQ